MYCQNCGSHLSDGDKFCGTCGAPLGKSVADEPKTAEPKTGDYAQASQTPAEPPDPSQAAEAGWASSLGRQVKEFASSKEVAEARASAKEAMSKAARITTETASEIAQSAKEFAASDEVANAKASAQKAASRVADSASKTAAGVAKSARDFAQSESVTNAVAQAEEKARSIADKAANSEFVSAAGKSGKTKVIAAAVAVVVVAAIGIMAFGGQSGKTDSGGASAGGVAVEPAAQEAASQEDAAPQETVEFTEAEKQEIRDYFSSYTYEDFVADLKKDYPLLQEDEIKSDQLLECYTGLMIDRMYDDLHQAGAGAESSATSYFDRDLFVSLTDGMAELEQQRETSLVDAVKVEVKDYAYDEAKDAWIVAGTIRNNADKAFAMYSFTPRAHVNFTDRDKYGEVTNSGDEWVDMEPLAPLVLPGDDDFVEGVGVSATDAGIAVRDLRVGEERAFVLKMLVRRNNESVKPQAASPECYVTEFSGDYASSRIAESELRDMSSDGIALADNVQLDPNLNEYGAYQGQIEVVPGTLTIDDRGTVSSATCSIKNNTGFYLENIEVAIRVYDQASQESFGSKAVNDVHYIAIVESNGSLALGPGMEEGDVELKVATGSMTTDSKAEERKAGTYRPEELGVVAKPTTIKYRIDVAKNVEKGLLPADWETRSDRYKKDEEFKRLLSMMIQSGYEALDIWVRENPEEANALAVKLLGGVVGAGVGAVVGELQDSLESPY